jgi:hypothetical protein
VTKRPIVTKATPPASQPPIRSEQRGTAPASRDVEAAASSLLR